MASTHNIVLNTITRERLTFGVLIFFRVSTRSNKILSALSLDVTTSFSPSLSLSLTHPHTRTHSLSQTFSLPFSTFLPSIFPRLNVSPGHRVASFCQDFFFRRTINFLNIGRFCNNNFCNNFDLVWNSICRRLSVLDLSLTECHTAKVQQTYYLPNFITDSTSVPLTAEFF